MERERKQKSLFVRFKPFKHQLSQRRSFFNFLCISGAGMLARKLALFECMFTRITEHTREQIFRKFLITEKAFRQKKLSLKDFWGQKTVRLAVLSDYKACQKQNWFPARNFISHSSWASFRQVFSFPIHEADIPGTRNSRKSTPTAINQIKLPKNNFLSKSSRKRCSDL